MAGNCDLAVKETDVQETLKLLGERLGYEAPKASWAPWVPSTHPLAYIENALRFAGLLQHASYDQVALERECVCVCLFCIGRQ